MVWFSLSLYLNDEYDLFTMLLVLQVLVHRKIPWKNRSTTSFKAETVTSRLLVKLFPEKIRHAPAGNQAKIVTNDGAVSKKYKTRLKMQKHEPAIDFGNENEEILITCDRNILWIIFFICVTFDLLFILEVGYAAGRIHFILWLKYLGSCMCERVRFIENVIFTYYLENICLYT